MEFQDKILFKSHQHPVVLLVKITKFFLILVLPIVITIGLFTEFSAIYVSLGLLLGITIVSAYQYFFRSKSYFLISNHKISIKVRNGFFSKFHMSIYYKNIKDIAYSKNNIFNYMFNSGTLFARSSAGAEWDFTAPNIPQIGKVYKYINYIFCLPEEDRSSINDIELGVRKIKTKSKQNKDSIIKDEVIKLLKIKWVTDATVLNKEDINYIFKTEEDRNHGIYETIKRDIVICILHDSTFRDPDAAIVMKNWNKVIFPAISFHEVQKKNTISSSPGMAVHTYLSEKFADMDKDDASILIWFDL